MKSREFLVGATMLLSKLVKGVCRFVQSFRERCLRTYLEPMHRLLYLIRVWYVYKYTIFLTLFLFIFFMYY